MDFQHRNQGTRWVPAGQFYDWNLSTMQDLQCTGQCRGFYPGGGGQDRSHQWTNNTGSSIHSSGGRGGSEKDCRDIGEILWHKYVTTPLYYSHIYCMLLQCSTMQSCSSYTAQEVPKNVPVYTVLCSYTAAKYRKCTVVQSTGDCSAVIMSSSSPSESSQSWLWSGLASIVNTELSSAGLYSVLFVVLYTTEYRSVLYSTSSLQWYIYSSLPLSII